MATLHLDRIGALWDTPSVTITRCMAAHLERNGKQINWGGDEFIDAMIDALERRQKPQE
jgi:hypothetical protein